MSGSSSGATQGMLPPTVVWVDGKTGLPTPAFFALILSLLNRTGGAAAPSGPGGQIGMAYLQSEINSLNSVAQLALEVGTIGLLMDDDGAVEPTATAVGPGNDSDNFAVMGDDGPYASEQQGQFAAALATIGDESPPPGPDQAALLGLLLGDGGGDAVESTAGTGAIYAPLVNGDLPGPTLMATPDGQCVMVQIA